MNKSLISGLLITGIFSLLTDQAQAHRGTGRLNPNPKEHELVLEKKVEKSSPPFGGPRRVD